MSKRTCCRIRRFMLFFLLILLLILFLAPIYLVTITSFKHTIDIAEKGTYVPWVDFRPDLHGWKHILFGPARTANSLKDSFLISFFSAAISLILGTMAGYGLARFNYSFPTYIFGRWRSRQIAFWFISQWMMPPIAIVFSFLLMFKTLNILDTHLGLIIIYLTFNIPFTVWVTRNFFAEIPGVIEESALIDGCSRWKAFFVISVPLAAPGLAASFIFCFVFSWNEFLLCSVLSFSRVRPLPLLIAGEVYMVGINWANMSAVTLVSILPSMIIAPFLGRFFARGLIGGLK